MTSCSSSRLLEDRQKNLAHFDALVNSITETTPTEKSTLVLNNDLYHDPVLPMILSTLLGIHLPVPAIAVILSQLISQYMPLMVLPPNTERYEASLFLH